MKKFKIEVNQKKCIGCGACASVCDNFKLVNGKSQPKKKIISEKELECNLKAKNICPVKAISVTEIR